MARYPLGSMVLLVMLIFWLFGLWRGVAQRLGITYPALVAATALWWLMALFDEMNASDNGIYLASTLLPLIFGMILWRQQPLSQWRFAVAVALVAFFGWVARFWVGLEPEGFYLNGHGALALLSALVATAILRDGRAVLIALLWGTVVAEVVSGSWLALTVGWRNITWGSGLAFDRVVLASFFSLPLSYLGDWLDRPLANWLGKKAEASNKQHSFEGARDDER
ncbi:hypothetical protein [Heliophilum fasciatum]|uniref:Uncharacterized protein n=1 Tax=Heliophilum fasciatum TaxID=35700 RepID=A0A4V2SWN1_9FIRM|nr:hypothetical protein [Heliophilum fasciatum]MCW2278673.1 hypothetical protein [Heliophilum fasciatum]TCP62606.1 hypothetical protein EDD73_12023 [Heliophilum fasciatum]